MSENARKRTTPESHLIEEQRAKAPARTWAGHVRISGDEGTITVPGVWHLRLPHDEPAAHGRERRSLSASPSLPLPLPPSGDRKAWQAHLMQLVTLRVPGMRLQVRTTEAGAWHTLALSAPTVPASVLHIDRAGLRTLLGRTAHIELAVTAHPLR